MAQTTKKMAQTEKTLDLELFGAPLFQHILELPADELIRELHTRAEAMPFVEFRANGLGSSPEDPLQGIAAEDSQACDWDRRAQRLPADLEVVVINGEWTVRNLLIPLPLIDTRQIESEYRHVAKSCGADDATLRIVKNYRSHAWDLAEAVRSRFSTLQRVAQAIVDVQSEALTTGLEALRPLNFATMARVLRMEGTTVARAVKNKFIRTPWGTMPLKCFLPFGTTMSNGKRVRRDYIRDRLQALVAGENPHEPRSDQVLVKLLAVEGIVLPLRTLTSHRRALNIVSSRQRRGAKTTLAS